MTQEIILIAAMDRNRVIGKDNKLPWNLPGDRKIFARRTEGSPVIMGRKTFESILRLRRAPLGNGRRNIVLTRQKGYRAPFANVVIASSWRGALKHAGGAEEIFVIGGEEIYRLALPYAHRAIITRVDAECEGDAFFPELDAAEWVLYAYDNHGFVKLNPHDEYAYRVVEYKKRAKTSAPPSVDMENARLPEQRQAMEGIIAREECGFCPGKLPPEHKQPIEKDGTHWYVTKNQWPYENTKLHLLLILKRHAETLADLKPEEGADLFELLSWAEKNPDYDISGGGVCMRFGDTFLSGGTVRHIHAQIIVPALKDGVLHPSFFQIGTAPKTKTP